MSQSSEEELIQRYFAAFNRHDLDGVLGSFHQDAIIVGSDGSPAENPIISSAG